MECFTIHDYYDERENHKRKYIIENKCYITIMILCRKSINIILKIIRTTITTLHTKNKSCLNRTA